MEFTIDSWIRGHHVCKEVWTPEVREELACQHKEGNPNDVYAVAVKANATKTFQIKYNNDLYSFLLHFIINYVLTEHKLAPAKISRHMVTQVNR